MFEKCKIISRNNQTIIEKIDANVWKRVKFFFSSQKIRKKSISITYQNRVIEN